MAIKISEAVALATKYQASTTENLKAAAAAQVAEYPQYANKFVSFRLAVLKKDIKTKMGVAGLKGQVVIAQVYTEDPQVAAIVGRSESVEFWSSLNKIGTVIRPEHIQFV